MSNNSLTRVAFLWILLVFSISTNLRINSIRQERALAQELPVHDLEFSREVWIDVHYKGKRLGAKRVDFFIGDRTGDVLLKIKAKRALDHVDFVQTLSYLKASDHKVGLLINFGTKPLEIRRVAN